MLLLSACILLGANSLNAQNFNDVTTSLLGSSPGSSSSRIVWGDIDNDNDLDFIITGQEAGVNNIKTRIYRNRNNTNSDFQFLTGSVNLDQLYNAGVDFGDYNNDGNLDLILCGLDDNSLRQANLYTGDGSGNFTIDNTGSPNIQAVSNAGAAFGDYDNDGDLDLVVCGNTGSGVLTQLYRNEGNSVFIADQTASNSLTNIENGSFAWGDYDDDGDLDLLMSGTGASLSSPTTEVFENKGNGIFGSSVPAITDVKDGSVAWGDYDNDGDLDILIAGNSTGSGTSLVTEVWRNEGSNVFVNANVGIPGIHKGEAIWGDIDHDGDLDIIIAGQDGPTSSDRLTALYRNNGSGGFVLDNTVSNALQDVNNGAAIALGEYNGDNKPDLLLAGSTSGTSTHTIKLYQNVGSSSNTNPPVPQNLNATQVGASMVFSWNLNGVSYPASLKPTITYNLYVGTVPMDDDIDPAMANISTGKRKVFHAGSVRGTSWRLDGLSAGTYYWGIQTVDHDFQGSGFATGGSFVYTPTTSLVSVFSDQTAAAFLPAGIPAGLLNAAMDWGDYDNDGFMDFVVCGASSLSPLSLQRFVYNNDGDGTFTLDGNASGQLPQVYNGDVAFGDIDNDGDLDIAICGDLSVGKTLAVYINNGTGAFTPGGSVNNGLEAVSRGSLDWGDYDNDGDQDLLVTGLGTVSGELATIYRNNFIPNGTAGFTQDNNAKLTLEGVEFGDAKFGDYNNDGWLDVALAGSDNGSPFTKVYRNDGDGTYTAISSSIVGVRLADLAWGDANNDGFLDLLVTGSLSSAGPIQAITSVYQYVEFPPFFSGFVNITQNNPIQPVANGSAAWGDYNDDGFLDILVSGEWDSLGTAKRVTKVYQNNGSKINTTFIEDVAASNTLTNADFGSIATWADYDDDQKLDIVLTGRITDPPSNSSIFKVFNNIDVTANKTPNPPTNLTWTPSGFDVKLSWDPPAGQDPNTVDGLTYAFYIDGPGGSNVNIKSPHANISNGFRKVVRHGDAFHNREMVIEGLSPGSYTWSVQAIDQDFEGSAFATPVTSLFADPTFIDTTDITFNNQSYKKVWDGAVAWGDYKNNDGHLDLVVIGKTTATPYNITLYEYDPNTDELVIDVNSTNQLTPVHSGSVDWGDYDNDGDIDLLVTGESAGGPVSTLYENLAGAFTSVLSTPLDGVSGGTGIFGDYDNDGWLDILISGSNGSVAFTKLYKNTYASTPSTPYSDSGLPLDNLTQSAAAWGDFNNDGYLDLIIAGKQNNVGNTPITKVYQNDTNGSFTNLSVSGLPGLFNADIDWGDYNADGFLDFVLSGEASSGARVTRVYKNNGGNNFTNLNATLEGVTEGSVDFGDYNNDGYKDLVVTGRNGANTSDRFAMLYRYNNASGTFVEESLAASPFPAVNEGSAAAWGDYDQDGKLDLVITGKTADGPNIGGLVLLNNIDPASANTPPVPTGLSQTIDGYEVIFSWNPPANNGYSYNIYVGTSPASVNTRSPMANTATGDRRIVAGGQVNGSTDFRLKNLPGGTYYWSVQAIDADFEGSAFASEQSFTYEIPVFVDVTDQISGSTVITNAGIAWGDYDNDNDLDLVVSGTSGSSETTRLFRNDGFSGFSYISSSGLNNIGNSAVAFGDYDNDNNADVIVAGANSSGVPLTRIYKSNGSSFTFTKSITGAEGGSVAWGDYDNDGDLDILLTGEGSSGRISAVFENDGNGNFNDIQAGLTPVSEGAGIWFDFNDDGFLDIALSGNKAGGANGTPTTEIFLNQRGKKGFTLATSLTGVQESSIDAGDYNNDGYPDLLITGITSSSVRTARVYRNNSGSGTFTIESSASATGITGGDARWGDYNNDGWLDFVVIGNSASGNVAQVFRNNGSGGFVAKPIAALPLETVSGGAALAWGDFDNDKKLDLAVAGDNGGGVLKLYRNVDTTANHTPAKPGSLNEVISGDTVILSWTAPGGQPSGTLAGISYNIFIGTAANNTDTRSPLANTSTGFRKIAQVGNAGQNTTYKMIGLPAGSYTWNVQAIDQDFEGSEFAVNAGTFTYAPPSLVNVTPLQIPNLPFNGVSKGKLVWTDFDGDEDLDIIISGETGIGTGTTSVIKNSSGTFSIDNSATADLTDLIYSDIAPGDYDGDGDIDLILTGEIPHSGAPGSGTRQTILYANNGNGRFNADAAGNILPELSQATSVWGDYDNDGDLDLLISGSASSGPAAGLYKNENGTFSKEENLELAEVIDGGVDMGDFDQDGDLDIVLTGSDGSNLHSKIYRNLGARGGFEEMSFGDAPLLALRESSAAWGDFNNDGFLDILLIGDSTNASNGPAAKVYEYNSSNGKFELAANLPGVKQGEGIWGDIDDDGFLDIVITGRNGTGTNDRVTRMFFNNGGNNFSENSATTDHIRGLDQGASAAFGDYDQDGKLDLAVMGRAQDGAPQRAFLLYENIDSNANTMPGVPVSASAVVSADSITFSWTPPAGAGNYTYNLYVGTSSGTEDIMPGMANLNTPSEGYRRIVQMGNTGHKTSWSLRGLEAGTYFWAVQAIDQDFEASSFTVEQSIPFTPPEFVDVTGILFDNLPEGIDLASVTWGDYDGDNDLDAAVAGESGSGARSIYLYENVNNRAFKLDGLASLGLEGVRNGDLSFGDLDGDGRLDLAVTGESDNGPLTVIYQNTASGFQPVTTFEQVENSALAWSDYDNDGDHDLFLIGESSATQAILYRNDGGSWVADPQAFTGVHSGDVAWADINGDGFQDVALTGTDNSSPRLILYRNNGGNSFTDISSGISTATPVENSSLDWADYDNDGFPDLLVSGENSGGTPLVQVLRNKGDQTFENISVSITGITDGEARWGDYNNDGFYDILVVGADNSGNRIAEIYENQSGAFTLVALASTPLAGAVNGASAAFGDYNQDGKLDILVAGETSGSSPQKSLRIYRNDQATPNTRPDAPENLNQSIAGSTLRLSWSAPSSHDPSTVDGLTYNITMGTGPDLTDVIPPLSSIDSLTNGYRRVVRTGNGNQVIEWDIKDLKEGNTYYWSVQAVDQDFEGSPFATFNALTFNPPAFDNITSTLFPGGAPDAVSESALVLGDYDNDGDLDILSAGDLGGGQTSTSVYRNDNGNSFEKDADASADLAQVRLGSLDWGDYDNDGDLDILLTGQQEDNSLVSIIYENNSGRFTEDAAAGSVLSDVFRSDGKWGDYDNDGDLDILLIGSDNTGVAVLNLYRNDGDHTFVAQSGSISGGVGISSGSIDWGDYDRDGWLDILAAGETATGALTRVYRNNGDGTFGDAGFTDLVSVKNSSASWGDFDNDGYADILLSGESASGTFEAFSRVYRYNSTGNIFENISAPLANISRGSAIWGDFDEDGWLDILVSGKNGPGAEDRTSRLYRNTRLGNFSEDILSSSDLENVDLGTTVFGDFDGDNKLDIILSGRTSSTPPDRAFAVFQNIDTAQNITPGPPQNLTADVVGAEITLSWDAPAGHNPASRSGLSYNVYIGTTTDPASVRSPHSEVSGANEGFRRIVHVGNTGYRNSWTFTGIPDGSYVWSVQTVDQDFEGSVFPPEGTFQFVNPVPDIISFSFADIYTTGTDTSSYIQVATDTIVDRVVVHYKGIAAEIWEEEVIASDNGTYTFTVSADKVDEMGLEYYFDVEGKFGFDISTDTIYTYRRYPDGFDITGLDFGKEATDYNIISVPLVLDNNRISQTIGDEFGAYDIYEWRFWHYQSGAFAELGQITTIEPGKGYSLITKENRSFNTGAGTVVEANDKAPFVINLTQGYNEIGNPYPYNLAWNDILDAMDTAATSGLGELLLKGPQGYQNGSVINKFNGGFVFADEAMELIVPVRKNPDVQRLSKPVNLVYRPEFVRSGGWGINFILSSGGVSYPLGGLGMHPDASLDKDFFDAISPPRMTGYLDMNFAHPEHFAGAFTRDIVPHSKDYVWDFTIETDLEERGIELKWENRHLSTGGKELILFDVEHQKAISMLDMNAYLSLSDHSVRHFRVYYGSSEFVEEQLKPDFIHLGRAYPNPSSGAVTIPFTLPPHVRTYEVEVAIYNVSGQEVRKISGDIYQEGFHEIFWDGKDKGGSMVPKGIYLFHLVVNDGIHTSQLTDRLVIR